MLLLYYRSHIMANSLTKKEKESMEKNYQSFIKDIKKFLYICKCCLLAPVYIIVIMVVGTIIVIAILFNMIIHLIKSFIQGIKNLFNNIFQ